MPGQEDVQITIGADHRPLKKAVYDANKELSKGFAFRKGTPFQGWAMSLMFFGYAIQRTMDSIWMSGTKTFQDVMHSVINTTTQFDLLDGSIAYLEFTIGQALEPIAGWLVPIIDVIAEWVSDNEELARGIFVVGTVVGTVFAIGGAAALALNGFIDLFAKLGLATIDAEGKITGISDKLSKLGGTIAIGFAIYEAKEAFDYFKKGEFTKSFLSSIETALLGIGGVRMISGKGGGGALIAVAVSLEFVKTDTFMNISKILANFVVSLFQSAWDSIANYSKKVILDAGAIALSLMADFAEMAGFGGQAEIIRDVVSKVNAASSGIGTSFLDTFATNYQRNKGLLKDAPSLFDAIDNEIAKLSGSVNDLAVGTSQVSGFTPVPKNYSSVYDGGYSQEPNYQTADNRVYYVTINASGIGELQQVIDTLKARS